MSATIQTYSTQKNAGTGETCTVVKPTGTAEGDMLVAFVAYSADDPETFGTPVGWTLIQEGSDADGQGMASFYKIAGASEPADYTFTISTATNERMSACVIRITGARIVDTSSEQYNTVSATATGSTITPTYSNDLILFAVASGSLSAGAGVSAYAIATNNPTWTELFDNSGIDVSLAVAYAPRPQTSATGSATATLSTSRANCVHLVALKEFPIVDISETITLTETMTNTRGLNFTASENVTLSEGIDTDIPLWKNEDKSSSSWINEPKS